MDCKYIKQHDFHEKYLLDRLSENEKSEYLLHIRSCQNCKIALDSENELIGSIRHFGKNEMKSEIAKQVAEIKSREKTVSWDMILKVAAIFFFLVITPGLVYYYQSVENPKISELYDFDEALVQPQELKIEKEEITEGKEKAENSLLDNSEEKRNGKITDVLGSAGGQGATPTIQSIRMAKPVKKSATRPKAVEEYLSEDEMDLEIEQPVSSIPKSRTLELDKFKKPELVSIIAPDLSRSKVLGRKGSIDDSKALLSQTSDNPKPVTPRTEKSQKTSIDQSLKNNFIKLDYIFENQKIIVNLKPLIENEKFYYQTSMPDSFPVLKLKKNKADIEMDWYVNSAFGTVDSDNILLNLDENNIISIKIPENYIYKINLSSDTTAAILIR